MNRCQYFCASVLFMLVTITLAQSVYGTDIKTADEFSAHQHGQSVCVSAACHSEFKTVKKFRHDPVANGECSACHRASWYPFQYGLQRDQQQFCNSCHSKIADIINNSAFVHGPIKYGDCTSCHNPHGSDIPSMLKKPYSELCGSCHNLQRLFPGSVVHKPVQDGNCGLCHDPHASNIRGRLVDSGSNLCITCHERFIDGMTEKTVHAPLTSAGCTVCHDPHSGTERLRLRKPVPDLCFDCHREKENEIGQYSHQHEPAEKGQCTECHSPHFSSSPHLLKQRTDKVCFACHEEAAEWSERKYLHGPFVQGNCTVCHNPHGADNAFILRLAFPHKFYAPYKKEKYALCFLCHKEALVAEEHTERATNFRNGDINLHTLHVRKEDKGRTCRACHDVHASNQEGRIRDEFPFGRSSMPLYYYKTENGGRCIPGCHVERAYNRVNRINNPR